MTARRTAALVLVLAACSRRAAPARADADASAPPPPDTGAHALVTAADAAATPTKRGAPATADEIAKQRRVVSAIARGRKETAAKRYPAAIAAFDEAVAVNPSDARALAERGYARLLEGRDLPAAAADLHEAAALATDKKLLSQIWFNLGLVEESTSGDNAKTDFWMANHLAPSAAARAKLGGKPVCPVRVDRSVAQGGAAKTSYAAKTWLALSRAIAKDGADDAPKTESEAVRALVGEPAAPRAPVLVTVGAAGSGREVYLVVPRGGELRATLVGDEWGGRCPGEVAFEIAAATPGLVHVRGREREEGGYSFMCIPKDGDAEPHPCSGDEIDDPAMATQSFCAGGTATARDLLYDIGTGRMIVVDRPELGDDLDAATARVVAAVEGRGLRVRGLDCDRLVGLDPAPDGGR